MYMFIIIIIIIYLKFKLLHQALLQEHVHYWQSRGSTRRMTPIVIPLDGNASLLLWRAMGTGVLKPGRLFPIGLAPVLWHRIPEVEALGIHLWEAKRKPGEVQCQSSPKQSMQFGLVTLHMYHSVFVIRVTL